MDLVKPAATVRGKYKGLLKASVEHERTPLLTSDRHIPDHAREMSIKAIDPRPL